MPPAACENPAALSIQLGGFLMTRPVPPAQVLTPPVIQVTQT